jgi:hypothetical protein
MPESLNRSKQRECTTRDKLGHVDFLPFRFCGGSFSLVSRCSKFRIRGAATTSNFLYPSIDILGFYHLCFYREPFFKAPLIPMEMMKKSFGAILSVTDLGDDESPRGKAIDRLARKPKSETHQKCR